ncbi:MAG: hypothetical protein RLZZ316_2773 [Bacteroidota bacterium]|jgi:hypothetical protein
MIAVRKNLRNGKEPFTNGTSFIQLSDVQHYCPSAIFGVACFSMKSPAFAIKCLVAFVLLCSKITGTNAQTLGGQSGYSFLKLANAPQLAALGGINTAVITNDVALSFYNPALLRKEMNQQLQVSFNSLYAGIKNYNAVYAFHHAKSGTNFSTGVQFLNYGSITQTTPAGVVYGNFRPTDVALQVSASKKYENKWFYGATLKYIGSNYGLFTSSAIAMDAGAAYYDSARLFQVSLLLKNMGTAIKLYQGAAADDLPFDIQIGFTKRLAKAPLQFSITAHHLHRYNISYNDTSFTNESSISNKKITADKLLQHVVFATQLFITDKVELTLGYNYLTNKELKIPNTTNGLTGFSMGVGVLFKKLQFRYARSHYQNNTGFNQLGLNIFLNQL